MTQFTLALIVSGAALVSAHAAQSDAAGSFAEAVELCLRFGSDPWFAQDRFEDAGWQSYKDPDFGSMAFKSPDGAVIALPPTDETYPM